MFAPGESRGLLILTLTLPEARGGIFGFISDTALAVDVTASENRPLIQGTIDVPIALGTAGDRAVTGVVMVTTSFRCVGIGLPAPI